MLSQQPGQRLDLTSMDRLRQRLGKWSAFGQPQPLLAMTTLGMRCDLPKSDDIAVAGVVDARCEWIEARWLPSWGGPRRAPARSRSVSTNR